MSPKLTAALVEAAIPLLGGLYVTLLAYGVVGGDDPRLEAWRARYGFVRVLGPVVMLFGVFLFFKGMLA